MRRAAPNSWQLFPDAGRERDDLAFAGALIDELVANWCADPGRVYSTGMSNGGFFTARLICEMSDRIAAAVSVAGHVSPRRLRSGARRAVHGDPRHRGQGGAVRGRRVDADDRLTAPEELRVFFEQVIPEEFAEFAADAGCDASVDTDVGEDVIRHELHRVRRRRADDLLRGATGAATHGRRRRWRR